MDLTAGTCRTHFVVCALSCTQCFSVCALECLSLANGDVQYAPEVLAGSISRACCRRANSGGLPEQHTNPCAIAAPRASSGGLLYDWRGGELLDSRNGGSLGAMSFASSLSSPGRGARCYLQAVFGASAFLHDSLFC